MSDKKLSIDVTVCDRKYRLIMPTEGGELEALRHGKPWRDLTGDNLVYWLAVELQEQKERIDKVKSAIKLAEELMQDQDNNLTDGAICMSALKDIRRHITKK